ncbi:unnamed protein product [Coffea canephora]|uniref:Uncharacterized protein n=1 Tax=Coffea canephora TaxID=49390 RepID=A0A068V568_COFCA|nr:uncharacterized protein LOC113738824 [Coffea arabica]CDP15033.1 unnamed protein product [Coffea canephora]
MLGRIRRASISSLELLEMEERPSPKLIKDDPLSIYESTLMKLREGSLRCQSLPPAEPSCLDVSCSTASDPPATIGDDCSSTDLSPLSNADQHIPRGSTTRRAKNLSVLFLFSKYKSPKNAPNSSEEDAMTLENVCSSACASSTDSISQFTSSHRQHLPEECFHSGMIQ